MNGGGGRGEVSENFIYEQPQINVLRMSVLNTSRVKVKIPMLPATEASTDLEKGKVTPN